MKASDDEDENGREDEEAEEEASKHSKRALPLCCRMQGLPVWGGGREGRREGGSQRENQKVKAIVMWAAWGFFASFCLVWPQVSSLCVCASPFRSLSICLVPSLISRALSKYVIFECMHYYAGRHTRKRRWHISPFPHFSLSLNTSPKMPS